jgi:hypothetical protein
MAHHGDPKTVALFYDGFEMQAHDHPFGRLRSDLRGFVRQKYRTMRGRQPYTGFYTAFQNLCRSLDDRGIKVRVNDYDFVRRNPDMPIGLSGYGSGYDRVRLPNPAMFGPGFVPTPDRAVEMVAQCNLEVVTLPSEWACKIWRPALGPRVHPMFVGIDTDAWPDLSGAPKDLDVIIYDKFRWNRSDREADILHPLIAELDRRGLTHETLRYGGHHVGQFRSALARTRSMVFLCEHETQGLAYQEAISSGVPIFAWDEGHLVDPYEQTIAPADLVVSSVPYFDDRCGMTFQTRDMIETFEEFWDRLPSFTPRDYVQENIGLSAGAARFLELFRNVA